MGWRLLATLKPPIEQPKPAPGTGPRKNNGPMMFVRIGMMQALNRRGAG